MKGLDEKSWKNPIKINGEIKKRFKFAFESFKQKKIWTL